MKEDAYLEVMKNSRLQPSRDEMNISARLSLRMFHITLLIAIAFGPLASAQELAAPVQQNLTDETVVNGLSLDREQANQIELKHGMSRQHVGQLMGPSSIESLIGSLDRSRATLTDGTELLFEQDCLIGIIEAKPGEPTEDGRLFLFYDRMSVVYDQDLVLSRPDNLPQGEDRRSVDDEFYFAKGTHGSDGLDIHFTPSRRFCLLNDCQGCEVCQSAGWNNGEKCCNDENCNGRCNEFLHERHFEKFRLSVDALFLSRSGANLELSLGDGDIQTEDLTQGFASGIRTSLMLHLREEQHLEFEYIGSFDWSAEGNSQDLTPAESSVLGWSGNYHAKLDDFQLNYVHRSWKSNWGLLCGVRYSEHKDGFATLFSGQFAGDPIVEGIDLNTNASARNRLLGIQMGTAAEWSCGRFVLAAEIKGGVFRNEMSQLGPRYNGAIDLSTNPVEIPEFLHDDEEVSFMGDFEFAVIYPITDRGSIRAGYQGLIYSDMVQVSNQGGTPAQGATLQYHGIFAGLEIRR